MSVPSLKTRLTHAIGSRPETVRLMRFGRAYRQMVDSDTDVCVEGAAFSANTFAFVSVWDSNRELQFAHHSHAAGQVLLATRLSVPTALLIRDPLDRAESHAIADGSPTEVGWYLDLFIRFYQPLLPVIDSGEVVVCEFDRVVADPNFVIESLVERFGVSLSGPQAHPREIYQQAQRTRSTAGVRLREPADEEGVGSLRQRISDHPLFPGAMDLYERIVGR